MSINTATLEALHRQLCHLATRLNDDCRPPDTALEPGDTLLDDARACDFLLPSPLTLLTLQDSVQKKIETVAVLMERAKVHESLPRAAQAAAEEENAFIEDDYATPVTPRNDDGNG